jgi:arylsulfatase A-like enzyme
MQRLRNGYFPKRSGDLLVDLVPGRIEERAGIRSSAGSAYDYDIHVPLLMAGCGLPHAVVEEPVDMASLPVTLARILGIQRPEAATAEAIAPIVEYME